MYLKVLTYLSTYLTLRICWKILSCDDTDLGKFLFLVPRLTHDLSDQFYKESIHYLLFNLKCWNGVAESQ